MTDGAVSNSDEAGTATATSLLAQAAAQQADAWERLVSLYGPLVYRWCRRWGLQATDAENVGQEVFARLVTRLPTFRRNHPGDTFRGWLYRIAYHCFVDHLRQRDAGGIGAGGSSSLAILQQVPAEADYTSDPALVSDDDSLLYRRIVELIRSEFSDRDWIAFYRVVMDGLTPAEAAAELNVSVNVVYLARSRVLRRVREEFAGLIPDES